MRTFYPALSFIIGFYHNLFCILTFTQPARWHHCKSNLHLFFTIIVMFSTKLINTYYFQMLCHKVMPFLHTIKVNRIQRGSNVLLFPLFHGAQLLEPQVVLKEEVNLLIYLIHDTLTYTLFFSKESRVIQKNLNKIEILRP